MAEGIRRIPTKETREALARKLNKEAQTKREKDRKDRIAGENRQTWKAVVRATQALEKQRTMKGVQAPLGIQSETGINPHPQRNIGKKKLEKPE